ncbi:D-2-hydroxyacid dehydrogenase [Halanaerobium sp. MA284_MarDTE_T2]|uniref:D-2-hydroxyacid dehydrogenase n=1 Tax=Halanaerobium sp. MA284_MarDTE_T2 TaxID=2183913 RepID=UPI000DF1C2E4|nr:D-2-hydroxyacid dehydrogenase [Halanaerobium sp. MA284_MarDTE_T2]RCW43822.1 phosphoglycerate dehydrogenase-like enzyme [Halanaerobium sp. MA284_MarDTE_T2]
MKIMSVLDLNEKYIKKIKQELPDAEVVIAEEKDKQLQEIVDTDIMVCVGSFSEKEVIEKAEKLKWIQSWSAGLDGLLSDSIKPLLQEKDIVLTNMSGIHVDSLGEQVVGYLIAFSRRFKDFFKQQQEHIWDKLKVDILRDKKLLIVGTGAVGTAIAVRAAAFGMEIIGIKRDPSIVPEGFDKVYSADKLEKRLVEADFTVAAVPLTEETRDMFNQRLFALMKDSAYFINIARGEVVVEEDLIQALKDGVIAGAALDVYREEPLPEDSPLYDKENLILTPHVGGLFPDYNKRAVEVFTSNIDRFVNDRELINIINYQLGY